MKNKITELAATGLIMFMFTGCMKQMSESIIDTNAGVNGGFEITQNEMPVNWQFYTQKTTGKGKFIIELDKKNFKEGKQSIKFSVADCSSEGGRFSPGLAQEIPANEGDEFTVKFWVKNSESQFLVKINGINATESDNGINFKSNENSDDWKQLKFKYTIPKEMNRLRIEINIIKQGNFWIDNFEIEKMESQKK